MAILQETKVEEFQNNMDKLIKIETAIDGIHLSGTEDTRNIEFNGLFQRKGLSHLFYNAIVDVEDYLADFNPISSYDRVKDVVHDVPDDYEIKNSPTAGVKNYAAKVEHPKSENIDQN